MIKNDMNFPLSIDTSTLKATNSVMMSATDAQLMPYAIGYVPFEMLEKSAIFRKFTNGLTSALPNNIFMYSPGIVGEATKGVPFVYTVKSGTEGSYSNIYYNGSAWAALPFANNNANMRILHSFDTDYHINQSFNFGANINGITLRFRYIETAYNQEGWQGSSVEAVKMPNTFTVSAAITPTPDIALTFTHNITSQYNGHIYTIDQTIFTKMFENGLAELDGGTYTYSGTDYAVKLYIFIDLAYIDRTYPAGNSVGFGTMCIENVRYSEFDTTETTYFQQAYNASSNKWLTGNAELFVNNYPSPYGYYVSISQTGISVFRSAVSSWINMCVSGGYNLNDIKVLICTALPAYKIGNDYYVAEFDDNYVITGKLIPYANARTWQTFINPDNNVFDYNDIPEPTPPGGDAENVGDNITRPSTLGIGGTNGFVTQYALRATDIQELGQILWTSVFDSDYWQNYMFSLALDTGSFSMSSLLSFFVSLKVYPFALVNVPSYSQTGKNMYVGTGIHALEFTNNLHTINNYCDYIPGGECTVWSGYFFNDYRDYINATYTLYVPYCGTIELNPGDVVHSTLKVQYAVDFATGGCVAYVDITTQDGAQFTIAALPGQMGADVPLTATAAGAVASRFIGDAMKFGGLISGEVSGVAGGVVSAMMGKTPSGGYGNVLSGMAGMYGGLPAAVGMDLAPGFAMQAANMISRGAVSAPMMSGGQGFASFGAPQTPYVQIRRGIYPDVSELSTVCGSRGAGTYTIGDLSGFVQGDIKTDGLDCPENEKIQIRQLIAKGIYV